MVAVPPQSAAKRLSPIFTWPRVRPPLIAAGIVSLMILPGWEVSYFVLYARLLLIALTGVFVFGLLERWPRRLPKWLARWPLQVIAVAAVMPFIVAIAYALTTFDDPQPWYKNPSRLEGYGFMTSMGILIGPWMAMAALYRHINGEAQRQALAFELERSQLERKALDARMRLLQAQVEPHFLFNTLANVRELVDSGSPQASTVLASLIAYLRAAVPRLHDPTTTVRQELELVRAYLEVMHMRMPDRLKFMLHADDAALGLECPSTTLLTLVENAVRHGIDPSEEGGRIEVRVSVANGRLRAQVLDTGVGLRPPGDSLGTGLANLRERLQLAYGADAQVRLAPVSPHGVSADVEFPARTAAT